MSSYEFYIASENEGKVREIQKFLDEEGKLSESIRVLTLKNLSEEQKLVFSPVENGDSFLDNARIKARALYDVVKAPVLADDSGLEVDLLNGQPGVHSSRYEQSDELRIQKLLKNIGPNEPYRKTARFVSCLCFKDDKGNEIFFNGKVEGLIIDSPRGKNGFGYDPVFLYPPLNRTFGELTADEKQQVSHRSRALRLFVHFLSRYI